MVSNNERQKMMVYEWGSGSVGIRNSLREGKLPTTKTDDRIYGTTREMGREQLTLEQIETKLGKQNILKGQKEL